jgi:tetratricopeptide (TPR) repeat protein
MLNLAKYSALGVLLSLPIGADGKPPISRAPIDFPGTYALVQTQGDAVPVTMRDDEDIKVELLGGVITLRTDLGFALRLDLRVTRFGRTMHAPFQVAGRYRRINSTDIDLTSTGGSWNASASRDPYDPTTLSVGMTFSFEDYTFGPWGYIFKRTSAAALNSPPHQTEAQPRPVPARARRTSDAPNAAAAVVAEGDAFASVGRWSEAEQRFREAVRLDRSVAEYHTRLAVVLTVQGRNEESLAESREALRLGPRESVMHYYAAEALIKLERLSEAETDLRHAIELTPTMWQYHGALGYVLLKQGRFAESLEASTAALELDPRQTWIVDNAGDALMELGRFSESESKFREAIRLAPTQAVVHYDLARLLVRQNRLSEAAREATRAVELEPTNAQYRKLAQEITHQRGRRHDE